MKQPMRQMNTEFDKVGRQAVDDLRILAIQALRTMYLPSQGLFAFRLRRDAGRDRLDGVSPRYTAIVLIALAGERETVAVQRLEAADEPLTVGKLNAVWCRGCRCVVV